METQGRISNGAGVVFLDLGGFEFAVLPEDFFEVIQGEMERDPRLVVASGRLESDPPYEGLHPRGTRVVRADFWRETNGLRYPETLGWESWLVFKALEAGMNVKRVPRLITVAQRPPKKTKMKKARSIGASMNNLGYFLMLQGEYERSRPLLERAVEIAEKVSEAGLVAL